MEIESSGVYYDEAEEFSARSSLFAALRSQLSVLFSTIISTLRVRRQSAKRHVPVM